MSVLVMMRHARTDYNVEKRLQGSLDIELGETGLAQARAAAQLVTATYGRDLRVVSSPLMRARATAQAIADVAGTTVAVDQAFTQRSYGVWEGLTESQVRERWPEEFARREAGLEPRIDGWGASADIAARVAAGMHEWWDPEQPTVVVSHGGAIQLGVMAVVGLEPASRVLGKITHGAWHAVSLGATGTWHLEAFGAGARD